MGQGDEEVARRIPVTPTTPEESTTPEEPTEIKGVLSEINSVDEGGGKEIAAFTYGDDGKVTKAIYTFKDPEGNTQGEISYAFTYSTDKIEVTRTDGDEVEKKVYTIEDGKVTKYESDWGYDALIYTEGKLTQVKDYDKENERFKKSGTSA